MTGGVRCALLLLAVSGLGCATARPLPARVDAAEADANSCESFSDFDPRARALMDELLRDAPGELLVSASGRLNAARRACARHTLETLLERRERDGVEAVQKELDALVRAWPIDRVEALLAETPALDLATLAPLVLEARQRAEREALEGKRTQKDDAERASQVPTGRVDAAGADCVGVPACQAVDCLAELRRAGSDAATLSPAMREAARACLDEGRARAPGERATRTSAVLKALHAFPPLPEATEAALALETLKRSQWAQVTTALDAGLPAKALALALPYEVLESTRAEVEAVRRRAVAAHLELARAAGARALAARLHRRVAATLGGPDEPPLAAQAGRWERGRWACRRRPVALPDAPPAMTLRLDATCRRPRQESAQRDEHRTFELEKELTGHALEGEVRVTCAGKTMSASLRVLGFRDDGEDADDAEVRQELERLLPRLTGDCQRLHVEAAQRACADLSTLTAPDVEQRFAEVAVATGAWPECFRAWFVRRYGVPPPALE